MGRILVRLTLCVLIPLLAQAAELLKVGHYNLAIQLFPKDERLQARAEIHLKNKGKAPIAEVPILLYRLLDVSSVGGPDGKPLVWQQDVVRMADDESTAWQVNAVTVHLASALLPGDSTVIAISYQGQIYGYPEVMAYTREKISESYTLLRDDVFAYPIVSEPSRASLVTTFGSDFSYQVAVDAPSNMLVACGGERESVRVHGDTTTFVYRNKVPVGRIDIACAPFERLSDSARGLAVYYLPADSIGARRVLAGMGDALGLFTRMFGPAGENHGYTVIEIPEGWGSQAGPFYALQTAAAFADSTRLHELWHEIGHSWNARVAPDVQRCRYFDEAFASYFESLAFRAFRGDSAFHADMESTRDWFVKSLKREPRGLTSPIADYGKYEIGGFSYTKGAWSLYVLNRLIGDEAFATLIRRTIADYSVRPIDFASFRDLAEKISGKKLAPFFDEWIYGTKSSELLRDGATIDAIVARYR